MANPIKYTTGSIGTPTPYLKKDNFWIGLDPVYYYGPSGTTNFWNGRTIVPNGYAIYLNKASDGPSIYAPDGDATLISTAKRLGASSSISSAQQALSYFYGLNTMICTDRSYPSIVWNGLKSFYDFGFSVCFPRGGSLATDIAAQSLTGKGSLTNVSYNSDLNGYADFNGTSFVKFDNAITPGLSTNWSVSVVMKATSFDTSYGTLLSNDTVGVIESAFGTYNGFISYDVYRGGSWYNYSGTTPLSTNKWYYLTWVHTSSGNLKMYINNWLDFDSSVEQPSSGGPLNVIGKNSSTFFSGSISKVMYYDKTLTYDEIVQNNNLGLAQFPYDSEGSFSLLMGGTPEFSYNAANETSGNISASTLRNLTSDGGIGATADFTLYPLNITGTIAEITSDWGGVLAIETGYTYISSIFLSGSSTFTFWMRYNGTINPANFLTYHTFLTGSIQAGGNLRFSVTNAFTSRTCTGTVNVCDGKWHHVCFAYIDVPYEDFPNAGVFIYVDGVLDASNTTSPISYFNSTDFNLYIGGNSGNTHSCYFGPINVYASNSITTSDEIGGVWKDYYYHVNRFQPES